MKKIAFTLYMISLIIMLPLYVIVEFSRETGSLNEFNPVSIRNEKGKTTGTETIDFSRLNTIL